MANPKYPQTSTSDSATLSAANTGEDGSGTIVTISTGTATGMKYLHTLYWSAIGNTTAGMLKFAVYNGSIYVPVLRIPIEPRTLSYTWPPTVALYGSVPLPNIELPSASWTLVGWTHIAETFKVMVQGQEYV